MRLTVALIAVASLFPASVAFGAVKLPALLSDNMVLEQNAPSPLWGWAAPGEKIAVSMLDQKRETTADASGHWRIVLDPIATHDPFTVTVSGSDTPAPLTIHNVLAGDVWIAGGQSNMEFHVRDAMNAKDEIAAAHFPQIRQFMVNARPNPQPQDDVSGKWQVCSPETVGIFTAVGYFFAREIHQTQHTPVGLIYSNWGGTHAESWISRATQEQNPVFAKSVKWWDDRATDENEAKYKQAYQQWTEATKQAKAQGTKLPPRPEDPIYSPQRSANLFNSHIHPLTPFAIRGVIWYQGESNAGDAQTYRTLFPALIQDWRSAWKNAGGVASGDFPFLFVQLANFMERKPDEFDTGWARLREAQAMALSVPNTGMAVAADVGEGKNIHPTNKQEVGHRLALVARALVYGEKIPYSGPMYQSMNVEGNKIRITFTHAEGLVSKTPGPETEPMLPPQNPDPAGADVPGFAIAGADHHFHAAHATIDGQTVLVWSDDVPEPLAVRYGFANNPVLPLYNAANLPAVPFRTDSW